MRAVKETMVALGYGLELLERCCASGLGFHEGDIRIAVENRDDPTWYRHIQIAPLYRRDLASRRHSSRWGDCRLLHYLV